jgi:uncharacterized protein (DUF952 family)
MNKFIKKFVYKICSELEWDRLQKKKIFCGTKKDLIDGFIHLSQKDQIQKTLSKHFFNKKKLILLKIEKLKLKKLVWEKSLDGILFPHLYSCFSLKDVKSVYKILLKGNGSYSFHQIVRTKKIFNRHPVNLKKLYFKKGKNIISRNLSVFFKKYKVHWSIQALKSDFKFIKKKTYRYTHFNIQNTGHIPGRNYLIIKVYKQGYFDGKTYKPSIFSDNDFILAKCISVKNNINYYELKKKDFKHSISSIKNTSNLQKFIKSRYQKTLKHLSDREKLSLGVAITELKIIKVF